MSLPPLHPQVFHGFAYINGKPATGRKISARVYATIEGLYRPLNTATEDGVVDEDGRYFLKVAASDAGIAHFFIDGMKASEKAPYTPGGLPFKLDMHFTMSGPAPKPEPVPEPKPVPKPEPKPAPQPEPEPFPWPEPQPAPEGEHSTWCGAAHYIGKMMAQILGCRAK